MREIKVKAYAKLNLSLDVLGKLEGGYHEMKMVMQTASLCDELRITMNDSGVFRASANFGFLPKDDRNIAIRAAKAFLAAAGLTGLGADIDQKKRIPVGAGLGGGSADAAAVLRGLNELLGTGFSPEKLEELGAALGSDVPFCVRGGTRLAVHRGEKLLDAPAMPDCTFVICKPRFSIRTPELFGKIDSRRSRIHPDTEGLLEAMEAGDTEKAARRMYNVFEDVLPRSCGEIAVIKSALLDAGALGAVMSGTGSAVFGVFSDEAAAAAARETLRESYRDCFAARPVGTII